MYVIIVYDVNVNRVNKVCAFLRRFLNWVQNSVFEGELTESELMKVENGIRKIIDERSDSVTIYMLPRKVVLRKVHIGIEKSPISNVI